MGFRNDFVVEQIWRYPVKSLGGERISASSVDARGLIGDRLWAVQDVDGKLGSGKSTTRFRHMAGLLGATAHFASEPGETDIEPPVVRGPDGTEYPVSTGAADRFIAGVTGLPQVRIQRETAVSHFDEVPLSAIGTATLAWLQAQVPVGIEPRRFRANLVVRTDEPFAEESWLGRKIRIGADCDAVVAELDRVLERCVMVGMAQPGLAQSGAILKCIGRRDIHPLQLAVGGYVTSPGVVRVNDPITVL
jgi:uncharacterized protein YcbX